LDRISKLPHKCTGSTGQPQQELWNGREVSDCRHPTPPTKKKSYEKSHSLDPEKSAILSSIVTSETISNLIEFRKKKASILYSSWNIFS
jgi:hypothetical protein